MQSVNYEYMDHHLCKLINQSLTEYSTITVLETCHSYNKTDPMEKMTKYSHFITNIFGLFYYL
jgi:hypothetical protein